MGPFLVGGLLSFLGEPNMKITQEDKDAVLAVLGANPNATTAPMYHTDLMKQTGLTSPKISAIRRQLLEEGRIREDHRHGFKAIYLVVEDKQRQVIDLIVRRGTSDIEELVEFTGLTQVQVGRICIQLAGDNLVTITSLSVKSSQWLSNSVSTKPIPADAT